MLTFRLMEVRRWGGGGWSLNLAESHLRLSTWGPSSDFKRPEITAVNFCQSFVNKRWIRIGSGSVFTLKCRIRNQWILYVPLHFSVSSPLSYSCMFLSTSPSHLHFHTLFMWEVPVGFVGFVSMLEAAYCLHILHSAWYRYLTGSSCLWHGWRRNFFSPQAWPPSAASSVADQWHFGVDPDPDPRIHTSD